MIDPAVFYPSDQQQHPHQATADPTGEAALAARAGAVLYPTMTEQHRVGVAAAKEQAAAARPHWLDPAAFGGAPQTSAPAAAPPPAPAVAAPPPTAAAAPPPVVDQQQRLEAQREQWSNSTRADPELGGAAIDGTIAVARQALDRFGTKELRAVLLETGLASHPELVRLLYRAGKALAG